MKTKLYEVIPGLFVRGHVRRIRSKRDRRIWLKQIADVVVGMVDPYMDDVARYVEYHHCPIVDGVLRDEKLDMINSTAKIIAKRYSKGKRIVIYCKRGRNRSCFMAALVVRLVRGVSGRKAMRHLQKVRPNSLANVHFSEYLNSLERP